MKVQEILDITNGELISGEITEKEYYSYQNDSRNVKPGDVFFALKTETNDGNKYINSAIKNGAEVCLIDNDEYLEPTDRIVIKVDDVLTRIQQLANTNRNKYNIPLICITGSVGKTTAKELINKVLEAKYNVLFADGNLNNHIGMPITLLRLNSKHDIVVLEAGMNHLKEIELLSNICEPTTAAITNIGTSHIGILGSKEKIKEAKLEIISGLKKDSVLYLNKDDEYLNKNVNYSNIVYYGKTDKDLEPKNIILEKNKIEFEINYSNKLYKVLVNSPGNHMVNNALLAIKIGLQHNIDIEDIISKIEEYRTIEKRLKTTKIGQATIIDDAYNASTISVKVALDVLDLYDNKKIAVLADMLEMGEYSEAEHKKVGDYIKEKNINEVISIGTNSKHYNSDIHFKTNEEAIKYIKEQNYINTDCTILFKGSNGMKLYEIINELKK
jgi:UDP-N-acetylmuramoyl-tripeptide--D-alanyl-D-alanine ligase